MHKVAKPFHTANRRFSVGQDVGPDDIQGAVAFEVWLQRGFIVTKHEKTPGKAAKVVAQE